MLTKEQRLEAYTYAYLMLLSGEYSGYGICDTLDTWGINNLHGLLSNRHVPEWYNQRPYDILEGLLWWPEKDTASRLRALERAIAECEAAES